jgi:hypothetical protein
MATTIDILTSSTDETGKTVRTSLSRQQAVGQISVAGTQTVTLQGRISSAHDWIDINSVTSSEIFLFTLPGELRVVTSGTSGGSSVTSVTF